MSYGYIGDTSTSIKQQVKNAGVLSVSDVLDLEGKGQLGGSLELIAQESYSSAVGNVDFTSIQENLYDVHLLQLSDIGFSTGNFNQPAIRFYESGVLETASVYEFARQDNFYNGTAQESRNTAESSIRTMVDLSTGTTRVRNIYIYLYNLGNSSKYSFATFHGSAIFSNTQFRTSFGGGVLPQASSVDGIRIFPSAGGNYSSYDIKLYGVKQI